MVNSPLHSMSSLGAAESEIVAGSFDPPFICETVSQSSPLLEIDQVLFDEIEKLALSSGWYGKCSPSSSPSISTRSAASVSGSVEQAAAKTPASRIRAVHAIFRVFM